MLEVIIKVVIFQIIIKKLILNVKENIDILKIKIILK